jgi:hypothetical protein
MNRKGEEEKRFIAEFAESTEKECGDSRFGKLVNRMTTPPPFFARM